MNFPLCYSIDGKQRKGNPWRVRRFISTVEGKVGEEERPGEREVEGQSEEVREGRTTCCFYVRSLGEGLTEVYCLP